MRIRGTMEGGTIGICGDDDGGDGGDRRDGGDRAGGTKRILTPTITLSEIRLKFHWDNKPQAKHKFPRCK